MPRAHFFWTDDVRYMQALFKLYLVLLISLLVSWLLTPLVQSWLDRWRSHLSPRNIRRLTIAAVAGACIFVSAFIVIFGRWQFGGFDYNILLEIGWRQILGQRPYLDFLTTSPPLFNLGMDLAFRIFGVSWDAMLYFTALFATGTLIWIFLLFRRLGMRPFAALGISFAIESAAMLTCCFWWYNNTTLILAAVFFFSCLLMARAPGLRFAQASFVLSLALLPLTKPNIAGVTIIPCLALLFVVSKRRVQLLLFTLGGAALCLLIFFAAHISIPAMLASYMGVAKERGGFSKFGFREMSAGEQIMTKRWVGFLCLPLLSVFPALYRDLREKRLRHAIFWLFFLIAPIVAVYGIYGNGEYRDVELTLVLGAIGLLAFGLGVQGPQTRRFTVALVCALIASDLFLGAYRLRVYTIGPSQFFEWNNNRHVIDSGVLQHMRLSASMIAVQQQVERARNSNPGPFFFGPRIDYNYAVLGLPSPRHFPAWWHPGTAFDRSRLPQILSDWQADRFPTLIFLRGDYTYYPTAFTDMICRDYTRDDTYPLLTIYHRRPGT